MGGFSALIDIIQSEYGWTDERVLSLRLPRLNQIRDALFIRQQATMYSHHYEIEWAVKQVCSMMVTSVVSDDKKWKQSMIKHIMEFDMDSKAEAITDDKTNVELSEADIEAMWAQGTEKAAEANASKPSLTTMRLG